MQVSPGHYGQASQEDTAVSQLHSIQIIMTAQAAHPLKPSMSHKVDTVWALGTEGGQ